MSVFIFFTKNKFKLKSDVKYFLLENIFYFKKVLFIAVELVDRREVVLGQNVVDPFLSLLDAGLSGGLEHVGEEILEVLVRQVLLGRD